MTSAPHILDDLFRPLFDHLAMRLRESRTRLRSHLAAHVCRGGCEECAEHKAAGRLWRGRQIVLQAEFLNRTARVSGQKPTERGD